MPEKHADSTTSTKSAATRRPNGTSLNKEPGLAGDTPPLLRRCAIECQARRIAHPANRCLEGGLVFETLTERMGSTLRRLRGRGRMSDANMRDALREVRMALIEADVALEVVGEFTGRVREKVLGQEVRKSLTPDQEIVRAVRDELCALMGEENSGLALNVPPPAVILVAGLQGSGKTTTVAKLSRWLREEEKRKVLVASCDVYRPAAIEQLRVLAAEAGVDFFPSHAGEDPVEIVTRARSEARRRHQDVLVLDTAGRMHVDAEMMDEVRRIHHRAEPVETLSSWTA